MKAGGSPAFFHGGYLGNGVKSLIFNPVIFLGLKIQDLKCAAPVRQLRPAPMHGRFGLAAEPRRTRRPL